MGRLRLSLLRLGWLFFLLILSPLVARSADVITPWPDPQDTVDMPPDWQQRPLVYNEGDQGADLVVSLDQEIYHRMAPMVQLFAREKGVKIALHEGTCGISGGMIANKSADITGYCCPPGKTDRLPGVAYHTLAVASLAVIVHAELPIQDLTATQVREIFAGDHYNWSEITDTGGSQGPDLSIRVVGRLHCKPRPSHWRTILDHSDHFSPRMQEVGTIPDMIHQVASIPGAIGFETLQHVQRFKNEGITKALSIDGMDPGDVDRIASGEYPFLRYFALSTWQAPHLQKQLADELVLFMLAQSEAMTGQLGWVPAARLRQAGWRFFGNEAIRPPQKNP